MSLFSRMIAWSIIILVLKWTWPWAGVISGTLLKAGDWLFGFTFDVSLSDVFIALCHLLAQLFVLIAVLALMLPGFRRRLSGLGKAFEKLLRHVLKLCILLLQLSFRALKFLAQGVTHEHKKNSNTHRSLKS